MAILLGAMGDLQAIGDNLDLFRSQVSENTEKLIGISTNLAVFTERVRELTDAVKAGRQDHDVVIELRAEVRGIKEVLARIESDIHELKKR